MSKKPVTVIFIILAALLLFAALLVFGHKSVTAPTKSISQVKESSSSSPGAQLNGKDEIFKNALNLYLQKKREGMDMSNGPCLGKIANDWVLDIAHNPRQPVDNKTENQCQDYLSGKAHHFIELDPDGKLIRSQ